MSFRPRFRPGVVAALVRRDFLTARSYRTAFILDGAFAFLNLLVYYFVSKVVGTVPPETLQGAPTYFAFATVGASLTSVMQGATNGLARRIREEQLTGTLEALVAQPIGLPEMAVGIAGFPFVFAMIRAAAYILIAAAFLGLDLANADFLGFSVVLVASGLALGAFGLLLGGLVVAVKRGDTLIIAGTFALGLVGGAVFPRTVLPGWLQAIGDRVPTRFAFDGVRTALFSGEGWGFDAVSLGITALVLFPLGIATFGAALGYARRRGSLGEY